jgi:integrase
VSITPLRQYIYRPPDIPGMAATKRDSAVEEMRRNKLVNDWFHKRALKSRLTAGHNVRTLARMCRELGTDPERLVRQARTDGGLVKLERAFVEYAERAKQSGVADGHIRRSLLVVNLWLKHRKVRTLPEIPVKPEVEVHKDIIPTPEQLESLLFNETPRGRVCVLLMAHSGVRPGVIGTYNADTPGLDPVAARDHGLILSDLPELDAETLEFKRVPFLIHVRKSLSKSGEEYDTFGSHQLAKHITAYLRERRGKYGETLTGDSPLVSVGRMTNKPYAPKHMSEIHVAADIRRGLAKVFPGEVPRPYSLRKYFSTRLHDAAAEHKILPENVEYLMGHGLKSIKATYDQKRQERLRKEYTNAETFLSSEPLTPKEVTAENILAVLASMSQSERDRLTTMVKPTGERAARPEESQAPRRVVTDSARGRQLVNEGWDFKSALPTGEWVLDPPAPAKAGQ